MLTEYEISRSKKLQKISPLDVRIYANKERQLQLLFNRNIPQSSNFISEVYSLNSSILIFN